LSENDQYDINSIKDINNIRFPPIDMESPLEDDGKYTIPRGAGVGKNKYGFTYRNNYIENENPYDNLTQLDLNSADDE
jgi:hypothetical protein